MSLKVSRRNLLKVASALGTSAALPQTPLAAPLDTAAPAGAATSGVAPRTASAQQATYIFFNPTEAEFVEAAVARLIPADSRWPGALEAGVPVYIDQQLAGAYGAGARLYLQGPWKEGTPRQGYQLPFTPAQLYRTAIEDIGRHVAAQFGGASFGALRPEQQDALLRDLESGTVELPSVPAAVFFETLLANTIEGFFADPAYGGNRDMVGWRMVGFPGAYASFFNEVEKHGMRYAREPLSMITVAAVHGHHG